MYPDTTERCKTSHEHPDLAIAFVIALDQQIIENSVLHSVQITSLVSLHLLLLQVDAS